MDAFRFDIDYVREQFPGLAKTVNGYSAAFLDGPGGTQVPKRVVDKISDYLYLRNANAHGVYQTSLETTEIFDEARAVFADFFNCDPREVSFGESTSTNNLKLAFAMAKLFEPGDEILITNLDHEANRSPWRILEDFGMTVQSVNINPETLTIDDDDFHKKISDKTKLLAINWAANSCGTVTDVKKYIEAAHKVGALTVVDAVHYAPHKVIDVKDVGMDFLLCSAYKFFGPHYGILYCNQSVGESFDTVRIMADDNWMIPEKFESGTPSFEMAAGAAEAVRFIADIGGRHEDQLAEELQGVSGRRRKIVAGILAFEKYEDSLADQLRAGISNIPGLHIWGPGEGKPRTPTVSFTVEGINAHDIAKHLADQGIFVWDGDFYAIATIVDTLQLQDKGGFLRIGLAPYISSYDIERTIEEIKKFCS